MTTACQNAREENYRLYVFLYKDGSPLNDFCDSRLKIRDYFSSDIRNDFVQAPH